MKEPLQEKIEQFLTGKMPQQEAHNFLDQISGDPSLMEEVDLQRKVIKGLKEYRYHQLKASLNAIPVSAAPWYGIFQSGMVKIVGGVAITATLGIGAYSYFEENVKLDQATNYIDKIDYPKNTKSFEWEIPEVALYEPAQEQTLTETVPANNSITETNAQVSKPKEFVIVPELPVLEQDLDEGKEFNSDMPEVPKVMADSEVVAPLLDVSVKALEQDQELSYRYFDGKLSLYGDFGDHAYQILEIYTATGKQLYLKFKGKYFEIRTGSEVQPLKAVTDQDKISKIRILELKN
jgi:hypothetical protein